MKKNIRRLFALLAFLSFTNTFSQKEGNIWHFGRYAGIDFNSGNPVAIPSPSQMNIWEGCSSIADENGSLLFYTDGLSVWNKNHSLMQNGAGLYGNPSSTQGALIVKSPQSETIYYIFTTDGVQNSGLHYSEVDMSLDGGLGGITTTKNEPLLPYATEKLCAVLHANSQDVWVITSQQNSNSFYAHLVTSAGVSPNAVVSNIGSSVGNSELDCIGEMKASRDGTKIAITHLQTQSIVCNFDNQTGQLHSPISINMIGTIGFGGCEFSASGNLLYLSKAVMPNSILVQYDLTSANVNNSATTVGSTGGSTSISFGALKRGPDNKIYVAINDYGYLGVINNPEMVGSSSDYVQNGVYLAGNESRLGLPNHINTIYVSYELGITANTSSLIVYPNPASDYIQIKSFDSNISEIAIFDISGKKISNHAPLEPVFIGDLENGTYILKILSGSQVYQKSFVKY